MARWGTRWTMADIAELAGQAMNLAGEEMPLKSRRVGGRYSHGTAGKRADLGGLFVRSRAEANYARWLTWHSMVWEYEPRVFRFPGVRSGRNMAYRPDFYLPLEDRYVEVKGYLDRDSQVKLRRMAKHFPQIVVTLVQGDFFRSICRQRVCLVIPYWECGHTRGS
jgi:hypothetical protein